MLNKVLQVITVSSSLHFSHPSKSCKYLMMAGLKVTTLGTDTTVFAPIENSGQALLCVRLAACNVPLVGIPNIG